MNIPPPAILSCPIVGMHFRPPAKEILKVLPLGSELILRPEPENPHDPEAIMVLYDMSSFPVNLIPTLDEALKVHTDLEVFDASELCAGGLIQLGYVAATGGKAARGASGTKEAGAIISAVGLDSLACTLGASPEGRPTVNIGARGP